MNAMEPEQFTLADTPMTDVAEGDAGLVPADASSSPPTVPPDVAPEAGSDNVSSLVQNLGAPSIVGSFGGEFPLTGPVHLCTVTSLGYTSGPNRSLLVRCDSAAKINAGEAAAPSGVV